MFVVYIIYSCFFFERGGHHVTKQVPLILTLKDLSHCISKASSRLIDAVISQDFLSLEMALKWANRLVSSWTGLEMATATAEAQKPINYD